ncbi:hypothetical protein HanIR_Chr08g0356391 [Helianthus annuus]|nr:hypothetical protein HanIR_Chr08g0356391 [Helianthus annuus]
MARFTFFIMAMLLLLDLLLSSPATIRDGGNTIFYGVAAVRPLEEKGEEYVLYKPKTSATSQGQGVDGCLPKGIHHNSGPSRYINYQTLGGCSTTEPKP